MESFKRFVEEDKTTVITRQPNPPINADESLQKVADALISLQSQMKGTIAGSPNYMAPELIRDPNLPPVELGKGDKAFTGMSTDDPNDFGYLIWMLRGTPVSAEAVAMAKSFSKLVNSFNLFAEQSGILRTREAVEMPSQRLDKYKAYDDYDSINDPSKESSRWNLMSPVQRKKELAKRRKKTLERDTRQFKSQKQFDIASGGTNPNVTNYLLVDHLEDIEKRIKKLDQAMRQVPTNFSEHLWREVVDSYIEFRRTVSQSMPKIYKYMQQIAHQRMVNPT